MDLRIGLYSKKFYIPLVSLLKEVYGDTINQEGVLSFIKNKGNKVIIATFDNNLVGCAFLEIKEDSIRPYKFAFVTYVAVNQAYRRNGIATSIFQYIDKIATENQCAAVELTSANFRVDAHSFYERIGFSKKKTTVFIKEIGGFGLW